MSAPKPKPRIGCAILAAGSSQRLGRPKQLLHLQGVPLVRHIANVVLAVPFEARAIVVGCHAPEVLDALAGAALEPIMNVDHREGVASSVRSAAAWARGRALDALLIVACDQLHLHAAHLEQLVRAYAYETDIVASQYGGIHGIPALFGRAWFLRLDELRGDRGAGVLLRAYPATRTICWPDGEVDIDTEGDLERHASILVVRSP